MIDSAASNEKLQEAESTLLETRVNLNEIAHENDQLRMAVARTRYALYVLLKSTFS